MKYLLIIIAIIACTTGCGGGFGTDSGDTKNLGPGIFGPDSAR